MLMKKAFFFIWIVLIFSGAVSSDAKATCAIEGDITVTEDFTGDIKFLGRIKNEGDKDAMFVKITFTLKNHNGKKIGESFAYVKSIELEAGGRCRFECYTTSPRKNVSSWSYKITWNG